jgi:hypothetical protein
MFYAQKNNMKKQRKHYLSQWAGQFFVAAELTKRGYLVSMPLGNANFVDLSVISPKGKLIAIDVKAQRSKAFWIISDPKVKIEGMFYVLVFIGALKSNPEYFIIPSDICLKIKRKHSKHIIKGGGTWTEKVKGFNFSAAQPYKDKWDLLPK